MLPHTRGTLNVTDRTGLARILGYAEREACEDELEGGWMKNLVDFLLGAGTAVVLVGVRKVIVRRGAESKPGEKAGVETAQSEK
jgi:hypothetical protein